MKIALIIVSSAAGVEFIYIIKCGYAIMSLLNAIKALCSSMGDKGKEIIKKLPVNKRWLKYFD